MNPKRSSYSLISDQVNGARSRFLRCGWEKQHNARVCSWNFHGILLVKSFKWKFIHDVCTKIVYYIHWKESTKSFFCIIVDWEIIRIEISRLLSTSFSRFCFKCAKISFSTSQWTSTSFLCSMLRSFVHRIEALLSSPCSQLSWWIAFSVCQRMTHH